MVSGVFVTLVFLLTLSTVSADKGMFGSVSLYEPGQKAIIAWDGENEVLILSTDVYASENSWALEVLPLPSEPTVTEGEQKSFENAVSLMNSHVSSVRSQSESRRSQSILAIGFTVILAGLGASMIAIVRMRIPAWQVLLFWIAGVCLYSVFNILWSTTAGLYVSVPSEVEIVYHENIGAHDITVVESESAQVLASWAENYLDNQGITYDLSPTQLENLTAKYIGNGMNYFVFDLVDLEQEQWSIEPIIYKFKSDFLYYPLEISSAASGSTEITIITITETGLDKQQVESSGFSVKSTRGISLEFDVSEEKLERLGPEVAELFDGNARLTTLTYEGLLGDLSGDLSVSAVEGGGIEVDLSQVLFWASIACLWIIIIGLTYHTLRLSER